MIERKVVNLAVAASLEPVGDPVREAWGVIGLPGVLVALVPGAGQRGDPR